jgi:hypothetical protein
MLLEHLQNAEVRKAAGESAAQRDANTCPTGQWRCTVRPGL